MNGRGRKQPDPNWEPILQVTSVPGRSNSPGVSTETNIHPTTALFRVTHFGCKNEDDRHDPNLNDHQHGQDLGKQQQQEEVSRIGLFLFSGGFFNFGETCRISGLSQELEC